MGCPSSPGGTPLLPHGFEGQKPRDRNVYTHGGAGDPTLLSRFEFLGNTYLPVRRDFGQASGSRRFWSIPARCLAMKVKLFKILTASLGWLGTISVRDISLLLSVTVLISSGLAFSQNPIAIPGLQPPVGTTEGTAGTDQLSRREDNVFLPPPREVLRGLEQARSLLAAKRYSEAVERLQEVLESSEDYFVVGEDGGTLRSLKAEALRLLRQSPSEAREIYRLRYATRAKKLLDEAVQGRQIEELFRIASTYPLTEAGQFAAILAAYWLVQEGEVEEAVTQIELLREQGDLSEPLRSSAELLLAGCYLVLGRPADTEKVLAELQDGQREAWSRAVGPPEKESPFGLLLTKDLPQWLRQNFADWEKGIRSDEGLSRGIPYFGGLPGRNSYSFCGGPLLKVAWRARVAEYPEFDDLIRQLDRSDKASGRAGIPAGMPILVDQKVMVRTLRGVAALDLATGKRLWECASDTPWEEFLRSSAGIPEQWLPLMEQALRIRVWWDATSGGLSSDGQLVFFVENTGLPISTGFPILLLRPGGAGNMPGPREVNSLVACEVETGRRRWELRGDKGEDQGDVGKIFFLGPPLPLRNRLYVLGVVPGEVRLFELEAATGRISWEIPIAHMEEPIADSVWRRTAGLTPSYGRGILVCPTGAGAIVGVDLLRRQLAWVTEYSTQPGLRTSGRFVWMESGSFPLGMRAAALAAAAPLVAEDRVIVAPGDGTEILCLDLRTGIPQWRRPRGNTLYVACVYDDLVLVVEPKSLVFLSLHPQAGRREGVHQAEAAAGSMEQEVASCDADREGQTFRGHLARANQQAVDMDSFRGNEQGPKGSEQGENWGNLPHVVARVELPGEAQVTGVGYRSGDFYYLPLSTGDVAQIDLRKFQLRQIFRGSRPVRLGNLVAWNGCILSQSPNSVELFYDADLLRKEVEAKLAVDPLDKRTLFWAGQIRLYERNFEGAIECFERLWQLEPNAQAFEYLRDAWLTALEADFERFAHRISEVENLFADSGDRRRFLYLVARRAEELGDWRGAWNAYRQLIELDWNNPGWMKISEDWQVRGSQWLRSRLREMLGKVPAEIQAEILQFVAARKPKKLSGPPERFPEFAGERWLRYFFGVPEGFEVALAAAEAFAQANLPLTSEFWYRQVIGTAVNGGEKQYADQAEIGLLQLYRQTNNWSAMADRLRATAHEEHRIPASLGNDFRQVWEQFRQQPVVEAWTIPAAGWPKGVHVLQEPSRGGTASNAKLAVSLLGSDGGRFLSVPSVFLISGRPVMVGYDAYGRRIWEYSWAERAGASPFSFARGTSKALLLGHLLVITGQREIVAIDTLNVGPQGRARLVWAFDVLEMRPVSLRPGTEEDGSRRSPEAVSEMVIGASIVPKFFNVDVASVAGRYVAIKKGNEVVLLEGISGELLWRRSDLSADTTLVASEDHLFLVHPGESQVVVLKAENGDLVGRVRLPGEIVTSTIVVGRSTRQSGFDALPSYGSAILCWELLPGAGGEVSRRLTLWDMLRKEFLWRSEPIPEGSVMAFGREGLVAIWQPDGLLRIYRLPQGELFAEVRLPPVTGRDSGAKVKLGLLCNSWQVLVIAYRGDWEPTTAQGIYAPPGLQSEGIREGVLYAFDWEGRAMWSDPVVVQNEWLPWDQPPEIPLLIFASYLQPSQSGMIQGGPELAISGIDRRTGQQVLQLRLRQPGVGLEIEGSPEERAVRIKLQRSTTVVRFVEMGQDASSGEEKSSSSSPTTGASWWEVLRRAAGDIFQGRTP